MIIYFYFSLMYNIVQFLYKQSRGTKAACLQHVCVEKLFRLDKASVCTGVKWKRKKIEGGNYCLKGWAFQPEPWEGVSFLI